MIRNLLQYLVSHIRLKVEIKVK